MISPTLPEPSALPTAPPAAPTLWPLTGLRVVSGDLELRYLDDTLLFQLAELAGEGVHAPEAMPFNAPWSKGTPQEIARRVLTYQWSARSRITPQEWTLELAVVRDGEVLGVQSMVTKDFLVTGQVETGSWLGLRHQGAGVGTRMRLMILHLAFDGLGAQAATTGAFEDNAASNGVTRKIGYQPNGREVVAREGAATVSLQYRLERPDWDNRADALRPEVTLHGVDGVRELLGVDAGDAQVTTTTAAS